MLDQSLRPLPGIVVSYERKIGQAIKSDENDKPYLIIRCNASAEGGTGKSGGK